MERTGTVIIGRTDYVVLGSSEKALEQAVLLAKKGSVQIIAEGTRLGTDEDSSLDTPDQYQFECEERCNRLGIKILYFLKHVDNSRIGEEHLVRVAGKGGLFGVICKEFVDCREVRRMETYAALMTREGQEGYEVLQVSVPEQGADTAHQILACKETLIREFIRRRSEEPSLRLGRFSIRPWGKADGRKAQRENRSLIQIGAAGQNRFGCYEFLEQNHDEAMVEAAPEYFDLVVAGGGTSGVMAAIHAARGGLRTVLIEPNYDLGGTQTVGGVSTYWFGHRYREVREIDELTAELCEMCHVRKRQGIWSDRDDFHPGLRSYVYLKLALEAGVKVIFGQIAYQAVRAEGNTEVTGVLTAGDAGNRIYFGKAVIDATGDGDLAVSAGAAQCYGSETDLITYWGSLAQYTSPDTYKNNFSSMLFAEDPLDYSRFIRLGRKRGGEIFDHGSYVSMRESRHIRGTKTVTLRDLITYRTWEDGLYTCYSNYDPKGKLDADMVYCGVLPPQVSIQIPLGALLPVDEKGQRIYGLYVAGKAISATHNVFPSIRMQPDLMHQGAVLGAILAKALQKGTVPEQMDAKERQEFLLSYSDDLLTLPKVQKTAQECAVSVTEKDRTHWVDVPFEFEETGTFDSLVLMAGSDSEEREAVKAVLRKRLEKETDPGERQMLIGYALWYGMDDWTEELCEAVLKKLEEQGLAERAGSVMCAQLLPDHGVMPEVVYQLNQLGLSKKPVVLKPFEKLLALLKQAERDYLRIQNGMFHYIEAFGYVAERGLQPEFAPMLKELLEFPELRACVTGRESTDLMTERFQILTFLLNRALAGLGDADGVQGLQEMLVIENMAIRGSILMTLDRLEKKAGCRERIW